MSNDPTTEPRHNDPPPNVPIVTDVPEQLPDPIEPPISPDPE